MSIETLRRLIAVEDTIKNTFITQQLGMQAVMTPPSAYSLLLNDENYMARFQQDQADAESGYVPPIARPNPLPQNIKQQLEIDKLKNKSIIDAINDVKKEIKNVVPVQTAVPPQDEDDEEDDLSTIDVDRTPIYSIRAELAQLKQEKGKDDDLLRMETDQTERDDVLEDIKFLKEALNQYGEYLNEVYTELQTIFDVRQYNVVVDLYEETSSAIEAFELTLLNLGAGSAPPAQPAQPVPQRPITPPPQQVPASPDRPKKKKPEEVPSPQKPESPKKSKGKERADVSLLITTLKQLEEATKKASSDAKSMNRRLYKVKVGTRAEKEEISKSEVEETIRSAERQMYDIRALLLAVQDFADQAIDDETKDRVKDSMTNASTAIDKVKNVIDGKLIPLRDNAKGAGIVQKVGSGIAYFSSPAEMKKKLEVLVGEKIAGNHSRQTEAYIRALVKSLKESGEITNSELRKLGQL